MSPNGSLVFKSLWRAWELSKNNTHFKSPSISLPNTNCQSYNSIWWNLYHNGKPLSLLQGCSARLWNQKGVKVFSNLLAGGKLNNWEALSAEFDLLTSTARTYTILVEACKNCRFPTNTNRLMDVENDLMWKNGGRLSDLQAKTIYKDLNTSNVVLDHCNQCWNIALNDKTWKKALLDVWNSSIEPKKACFKWLVLLQKLPFKSNKNDIDVCSICCIPKFGTHILFDCFSTKEIWKIFCLNFKIWDNDNIRWKSVLFCHKEMSKDCLKFWNLLSVEILWHIWKARNEEKFKGYRRVLTESHKRLTFLHVIL